ncbi:MAG: NAD(P)H-dependent oxidoreductase [Pseudomonadales bacterium]|nr:NAD(P)H-dependent oxidoreductase [Pseudomonadales bacterium]
MMIVSNLMPRRKCSFYCCPVVFITTAEVWPFFDNRLTEVPALNKLPIYCEDIDKHKPKIVQDFLLQVESANGILFCTPEYNHSIPAVLKNAIDWASRPAFNSPLKFMPVSFITQAVSPVGGARAQAHLKLVLD